MMTGCAWCNVGPEDECEMDCITRHPDWVEPKPDKESGCPDGGTCHHGCGDGPCFRVTCCGPLSNVFPGDEWPDDIKRQNDVAPRTAMTVNELIEVLGGLAEVQRELPVRYAGASGWQVSVDGIDIVPSDTGVSGRLVVLLV